MVRKSILQLLRNLTATLCLTIAVLCGCMTPSPNNLSAHYNYTSVSAELYADGKIIDLSTFNIEKPSEIIVFLSNHGTRNWREAQACRPNNSGTGINKWKVKNFAAQRLSSECILKKYKGC
tara:strand:+ start:231 stop:593 length:363 start_codon:yes stop_codon:yes gene_type:complete